MTTLKQAILLTALIFALPMFTIDQAYAKDPNAIDVPGGSFTNNDDAKKLCPDACKSVGRKWNGNWGPSTVKCVGDKTCPCSCDPVKIDLPAGSIANDEAAKSTCPKVCASLHMEWAGTWATLLAGKSSTCTCKTKM